MTLLFIKGKAKAQTEMTDKTAKNRVSIKILKESERFEFLINKLKILLN